MPAVTVRYFAMLREQRGCEVETLVVPEGATAGSVYDELFPPGPMGQMTVAFAVNQTYASRGASLKEGDELAFIPPVGGG